MLCVLLLLLFALVRFHLCPSEIEGILHGFKNIRRIVIDARYNMRRFTLHVYPFENRGIVRNRIETGDVEEEVLFTLHSSNSPFGEERADVVAIAH
uniref:Putative secreted protein n=1 Tax=Anopheles triannulatus TaxID=58253 RepID=A0A2M4B3R4_9DIPT